MKTSPHINMNQSGKNGVQIGSMHDNATVNIVSHGVTEARAAEIFDERLEQLLANYSVESHEVAIKRNRRFMRTFIDEFAKRDFLKYLSDPSIQIILAEAQKAAASSDSDSDYQILVDLLAQRVEHNGNRNVKANVSYAVNAIDKISDEALFGLTLIYMMQNVYPDNGKIFDGIKELNNNLSALIGKKELPDEERLHWLYELEILNLVHFRAGTVGTDFFSDLPQMLPGYVALGLRYESAKFPWAMDKMNGEFSESDLFVSHEFFPETNYLRIPITYFGDIEKFKINDKLLTLSQKNAMREIFDCYTENVDYKEYESKMFADSCKKLRDECAKQNNLNRVQEWGSSFPYEIKCTLVGCLLGYINAKRHLPNLSPYDGAFGEAYNDNGGEHE